MSGTDYTQTTNYGLYKPLPSADINQWGSHLNLNADTLDGLMHGFLPLSGGTVSGQILFQPANTVSSGAAWIPQVWLSTGISGATTAPGLLNVHQITINSDTLDASSSGLKVVNYSAVNASFGGPTMKGFRQGFAVSINLASQSGNTPSGSNYVGIVGSAAASAPDNGTGLTPFTCGGAVFGANFYASTGGAAHNFGGVCGIEVNPAIGAGSTAVSMTGIQVIPTSGHTVRGAIGWDIGYLMASQPGAQGIDIGYCVGTANGGAQWPIRNDGSLFRGALSYSGGASARHGIQLNEVSFPAFGTGQRGGAFVSNGFAVDGLGQIQCGPGYLIPGASGLTIDAIGSVGTGTPTVAAGGGGYTAGDVLYDPYGGVYVVSSIVSGAVTAVTVLAGSYGETHQPVYPSHIPPANPVATSTWSFSHGGSGCTLNLTWNTTATTLSLNPTGQQILTNLSAATTDAAAATAGVPIGGLYNNAGVVHVRLT